SLLLLSPSLPPSFHPILHPHPTLSLSGQPVVNEAAPDWSTSERREAGCSTGSFDPRPGPPQSGRDQHCPHPLPDLQPSNTFLHNGPVEPYHRSPPRPSPGSLHYSDEDVSTKYNDLIPAENSSLTEKPSEISDSQGSDSEYEVDQNRGGQQKTHSFVNHYISDPTYYNSWRRQQKGVSRPPAYGYTQPEPLHPHPLDEQDPIQPTTNTTPRHPPPLPPLPPLLPRALSPSPQPQGLQGLHSQGGLIQGLAPQGQGTLFRSKGSRTPTPSLLSCSVSEPPSQHGTLLYSSRPPSSLGCSSTQQPPTAGFSSFV
uniref:Sidekick cell adhesion molecule 2 n=1 Tax=Salmo trutta TaxID=8032 RepID=A0A673YTB0_SALTR